MHRTIVTAASRWAATGLLLLAFAGSANAQTPVAVDDAYTVRSGILTQVEAPGVLENDHDGGGEPPPPPTAVAHLASDVSHGVLFLNGDGSFDYTSEIGYVGPDTFTYYFMIGTATSNTATVTLSVNGCEAGALPTQWVCWAENAYLAKAAELNLSAFVEGFEDDVAWAIARSPDTAPSVTSQSVAWASNFSLNGITSGPGPARSGDWGVYSYPHGDTTGAPSSFIHDGFTATGPAPDSLLGVGGWLVASQLGSRIRFEVSYDGGGTATVTFPNEQLNVFHTFFGFIDTAGFTMLEMFETEGTVNQQLYIFGDDFSVVVPGSDTTPPQVVEIGSWEDTGDGVLSEGEITDVAISELMVRFNEPVQDLPGDADPDDVTNPANYLLLDDGGNGFDTVDCAGGVAPGDNQIPVAVWSYTTGTPSETWLEVNSGTPLPPGVYRLLVCGTTSIVDWAGNVLDGDGNGTGGDDFVRNFEISSGVVPTISIGDASVVEGDVGTVDASFTITLSTGSDSEVRVDYATAAGTATEGVDYLSLIGTAIFPPQSLTQTVNVHVVGDLDPELDETFSVELSAPVNATIADPSGAGTIIDDDAWTWYVSTGGNDGNDCLTASTACRTIVEAVSRAAAGDLVNVARGTYLEHLVLGVDLTLSGELPLGTVVDGGGTGVVVQVAPARTVTMSGFEIRNGAGGGIANQGDLTLEDCWVHDNGDGTPSTFGGLRNDGVALVDRVAIVGNVGDTAGGVSNSGQLEIWSSTISGNAASYAPGIDNLPGGSLALHYSTVAGNGSHGIRVAGTTSLRGTIVAGHTTANCDAAVTTLGHNLEDANSCGLVAGAGDLIGVNPLLAPLRHHGGSSPTLALGPGSPAVDAAEMVGVPAADQRGADRPLDGDLDGTAVGDIGAYEVRPGELFDDGFESGDTLSWSG